MGVRGTRVTRVGLGLTCMFLAACTPPQTTPRASTRSSPTKPITTPAALRGPGVIPTRLPGTDNPAAGKLIPDDARLLTVQRVAMSGGERPEIVVTWERLLGRNQARIPIKDNGLGLWHRSRRGWRLAFHIHETPLEETTVGKCYGLGCYRSKDGSRLFTPTFVILVSWGSGIEAPLTPGGADSQFIRGRRADLVGGDNPDLFIVQDDTGSAGASIYRVLTWRKGAVHQVFRRVHGDGCIVPAKRALLVRGSVYRSGDSHCCPSLFKYSQLTYHSKEDRFVPVRSEKVRLPPNASPQPPAWASELETCGP